MLLITEKNEFYFLCDWAEKVKEDINNTKFSVNIKVELYCCNILIDVREDVITYERTKNKDNRDYMFHIITRMDICFLLFAGYTVLKYYKNLKAYYAAGTIISLKSILDAMMYFSIVFEK